MLEGLTHWHKEGETLKGEFTFKDFAQAFAFLTKVAALQEEHNHHAKIENTYNRVTLTLTTHDAGHVITKKDVALAHAIEGVLS